MIDPKKRKAASIEEKMDFLAQVGASKVICVGLAAKLGIVLPTLSTTVKKREGATKCCVEYGRFSCQKNNLQQTPFQELKNLLAACLKQARTRNAVTSCSLLKEKALHIATRLGIKVFTASNG
jgi:hypothetical protein